MKKNIGFGAVVVMAAATLLAPSVSWSKDISGNVIKIGIMNDQSGPYADNCGGGSVVAAKLAIEDAGGAINGKKVEVLVVDDQNKPDIGSAAAHKWIDQDGVDAIVGCSASSIAGGVSEIMKDRQKPYMLAGTAAGFLTNERCSPMNTQWVQDTYSMSKASMEVMLEQGKKTYFFITVDYAFGKAWQDDAVKVIEARGGKVLGTALHPLNSSDFSSYILKAQSSGAEVIAIANAGADLANTIKQAAEFGIGKGGQTLAPLGMLLNNIHAIGLDHLEGVRITTLFYWDQNAETRAFATRYRAAYNGRYPNEMQSATYSAVTHYLKAVAKTGTDDGPSVMAEMRKTPVNDFAIKNVNIRADGQVLRPVFGARIKNRKESKAPYDYYEIASTIGPDRVWRPASESVCPLLKAQ
jgi:branched-chain amino acid transport system substrate-binding protein